MPKIGSLCKRMNNADSIPFLVSSVLSSYLGKGKSISNQVAISTAVGFCVHSLTTQNLECCLGYLKYVPWITVPIVAPIATYKLWAYRRQNQRQQNSVEVLDETSITQLIKYMTSHEQYYSFNHVVIVDQNGVCFRKLNGSVQFHDIEYDVKGEIIQGAPIGTHKHKQKQSVDEKKSDKPKSVKRKCKKDEDEDSEEEDKKSMKTKVRSKSPSPIRSNKSEKQENKNGANESIISKLRVPPMIVVVTQIGSKCRSVEEYVKHIIQYRNEKQVVQIVGDQFVLFRKYVNLNREFYVPEHVKLVGNNTKSPDIFFPPYVVTQFNDSRFNVRGTISWTYMNDGLVIISPLTLDQNQDMNEYVTNVLAFINQVGGHLTLYNMEKLRNGDNINMMYDGVSEPIDVLEKRHMKTLFHEQTDALWSMIKTINYYPEKYHELGQSPHINLLLHGPPGTGKSTFAYRVAMATKRHIINIKISKYNRVELMKVFTNPQINMNSYRPKDIVYVLDEFDGEIDRLMLIQSGKKHQLGIVGDVVKKAMDSWSLDKGVEQVCVPTVPSDERKIEKSPAPQRNVKVDQLQRHVKEMDDMVEGITRVYDRVNDMKDDVIDIRDLLTVFQGAVPVEGAIIIAMTNKYEYLREVCPQLFRTGRLTPVYFGNFNRAMLEKVSVHYFGKDIPNLTTEVDLQPSVVIDIVLKSILETPDQGQQYCHFLERLRPLCQKTPQ
jgi:hypothetical protein